MILDAHVHVWDPGRADYPWLGSGMGDLARAIGPDELAPTLTRLGVQGVVLVQASDNAEDTAVRLETAEQHPQVVYSSTGDLGAWTVEQVRPFCEDALELFGPARLMYGGEWPISMLAGGYDRTWAAMTELLAPLSEPEREAILGGTAELFYALDTQGDG